MTTRNSLIAGIPDGVRLALTDAATDPSGRFAPGVSPVTLGWIKRRGYGRRRSAGDWVIEDAGRDALARAELALMRTSW